MAVDVLATCVARSSAAMALAMYDIQVLDFHDQRFQVPDAFQYQEMMENANIFLQLSKKLHT